MWDWASHGSDNSNGGLADVKQSRSPRVVLQLARGRACDAQPVATSVGLVVGEAVGDELGLAVVGARVGERVGARGTFGKCGGKCECRFFFSLIDFIFDKT